MKISISMLFLLIIPTAAIADDAARPHFQSVAGFLTWADKKLAEDDYDALVAAQDDSNDAQEKATKLAYLRQLDSYLKDRKLAKLCEGREFPKDATTFTLGGHEKELGHCHIDFEKEGDSWQIAKIWQCR